MHRINEADKDKLLQVCRELGIPDAMGEGIVFAAHALHDFECDRESRTKSKAKRRLELESVARLARDLNTAVQGLDFVDRCCIDDEFKMSTLRIQLDPPSQLETIFHHALQSNVLRIGDVLLTLAAIAKAQANMLPQRSKGGRPSVVSSYSYHLLNVARLAFLHDIQPGQNDKFLRLCEAVFVAAGVKVSPENAIRFFMNEYAPELLHIWKSEQEEMSAGNASLH